MYVHAYTVVVLGQQTKRRAERDWPKEVDKWYLAIETAWRKIWRFSHFCKLLVRCYVVRCCCTCSIHANDVFNLISPSSSSNCCHAYGANNANEAFVSIRDRNRGKGGSGKIVTPVYFSVDATRPHTTKVLTDYPKKGHLAGPGTGLMTP